MLTCQHYINTFRPEERGRQVEDDIPRRIFLNEKSCILIQISQQFVPKDPMDNTVALLQ